jgi:hypothetical protein
MTIVDVASALLGNNNGFTSIISVVVSSDRNFLKTEGVIIREHMLFGNCLIVWSGSDRAVAFLDLLKLGRQPTLGVLFILGGFWRGFIELLKRGA